MDENKLITDGGISDTQATVTMVGFTPIIYPHVWFDLYTDKSTRATLIVLSPARPGNLLLTILDMARPLLA